MRGSTDRGEDVGRTSAIGTEVPWDPRADTSTATAAATRSRMTTAPFDKLRERSEEHTSELQSRPHLVCRLLLEKKKRKQVKFHLTWLSACYAPSLRQRAATI